MLAVTLPDQAKSGIPAAVHLELLPWPRLPSDSAVERYRRWPSPITAWVELYLKSGYTPEWEKRQTSAGCYGSWCPWAAPTPLLRERRQPIAASGTCPLAN